MSSLLVFFRLSSFLAVLGLVAAPAVASLAAEGEPVAVAVHHDGSAHHAGESGAPQPASQQTHCPPAMVCAVKCVTGFSVAGGPVQQGLDLVAIFLPNDDLFQEPFGPSPLPRPPRA